MMRRLIEYIFYWVQNRVKRNYFQKNRKYLTNTDFTIISNNCWGGILYSDLQLAYKTPFVNMFIHAPCYIKLLENLDYYLGLDLVFTKYSRYNLHKTTHYPIGILNDVEIHFIHHTNEAEVLGNWNRRKLRINRDNLIIIMSDRDLCTRSHIERFDSLPFANKICFTAKRYPYKSCVQFSSMAIFNEVLPADQIAGLAYSKVNIIQYLNNVNAKV